MLVEKTCFYDANPYGCWQQVPSAQESGAVRDVSPAFIDASGRTWINENNNILVDTNGFKEPNLYGKDRWAFLSNVRTSTGMGFNWSDTSAPNQILYSADRTSSNATSCPTGNCKSTSWLQ